MNPAILAFSALILVERPYQANDVDALTPELWSKFGLAILEANMVAGRLVHRDFENDFARFGDVVNTRKPQEFSAKRKTNADTVTVQDAVLTNIPVTLNQHLHVSFLLKDGEETLAMGDLVTTFLQPAITAMADMVDSIVLGQYPRFMTTAGFAGGLGLMSSSNAKDYILDTGKLLDDVKCPQIGRSLIVSPAMKATILKNATFSEADKRGDNGSALREASLGRILGFDAYMCQNMASISAGMTSRTFQINNAAGYPAGTAGSMTIDTGTGEITLGSWVKIAGKPYRVTARTGTAPTTAITVSPALREAVADDATVIVLTPGAVNLGAGYAAGYAKEITVDGFSVAPRRGQFVTFGTATDVYTIVGTPTTTSILLDRPLVAAIVDDAAVNVGPQGDYGFGFSRNAVALVCRPLALPRSGTGALAGYMAHNGFALRTVITYDGDKQGHLVTIDTLLGIAVLDTSYGAVIGG